MKKILFAILMVLIIAIAATAVAAQVAISSGLKTGSAAIVGVSALLTDVAVFTNGTNAVTVICYDNATAASGTEIAKIIVPGASYSGGIVIPAPVLAMNGIYCSLSGTGGSMIIFYAHQ
jgi:hypothetical protein